jgi:hypothetical protein
MSEWQPIETAPDDGFFLVCRNDAGDFYDCSVAVVHWRSDGDLCAYLTYHEGFEYPYVDGPATHWMPLPDKPTP